MEAKRGRKAKTKAALKKSAKSAGQKCFVEARLLEKLVFVPEKQQMQERARRSQQNILAAAIRAFMEQSYDGVSTHDVANEANVTQGLVTYHFKSKEGLWQASMDKFFGDFRNHLANRISELNDIEDPLFYKLIIKHLVRWPSQYPYTVKFMTETGRAEHSRIEWVVKRHIRPVYEVLAEIFERGKAEGIIKDFPTLNLFYLLMTASTVFALRDEVMLLSGVDVQSPDFIEVQADTIMRSVVIS